MAAGIDVVIPAYRAWAHTRSCLEHLAAQTVPHTVLVVDNGCPEHTAAGVRAEFPAARVVENGANLGFAVAVNRGARAGDGEILVVLNNDVDVEPDFLARLADAFAEPAVGSGAPLLLRPDRRAIDSFGIAVDATLAGFVRLHGEPLSALAGRLPPLLGPYGAAAAYRRRAYEQVGGLDERLFMYHEELDLALRLRVHGWRAAATAEARGVHAGGASAGVGSAWQRRQAGFGRGYLLRRYGVLCSPAGPRALLTEAAVVAGDAILARDTAAWRGRWTGWRAARGLPRHPRPALDGEDIGFLEGIRLRGRTYRAAA